MAGYSPGWNDPPSLSFSQCNLPAGKRNLLNKRVPFPLNQSANSAQPEGVKQQVETLGSVSSLSTVANADTPSPAAQSRESDAESKIDLAEEDILPFVMNTFKKILSENSDSFEKKRIDEINQRLKIMEESWDSKISLQVKHKMHALAQELSTSNAEGAMKIQCILMVDYLREVKQWMVGVKHIIEMERQKVSSTDISVPSND